MCPDRFLDPSSIVARTTSKVSVDAMKSDSGKRRERNAILSPPIALRKYDVVSRLDSRGAKIASEVGESSAPEEIGGRADRELVEQKRGWRVERSGEERDG